MQSKASQFLDLDTLIITIDGKEITDAVVCMYIFQDIFNPVWQANIELIDTTNKITYDNIKSNSVVSITMGTKQGFDTDGDYSFKMSIYEIGDRVQQNSNTTSYVIKCANADFIKNNTARVKKSFCDKKQSDIVRSIVSDCLSGSVGDSVPKPAQLQPHTPYKKKDGKRTPSQSDQEITWLAPNISPFNAIAQMLKSSMNKGKADFVFFTKNLQSNIYSFESLSGMWDRKPCVKFVQRPNAIKKNGDYPNNKNLEFSHFAFDHFNTITNTITGYNGTTAFTYDVKTKQWSKNAKGQSPDAACKFLPVHKGIFSNGSSMFDNSKEWFQTRREELFNSDQNLLKIQTPGHVKAFQWLGETCEIDLPSNNSVKDPLELDEKYKGKYMIVAVGHVITKQDYFVNIELANGWDKK